MGGKTDFVLSVHLPLPPTPNPFSCPEKVNIASGGLGFRLSCYGGSALTSHAVESMTPTLMKDDPGDFGRVSLLEGRVGVVSLAMGSRLPWLCRSLLGFWPHQRCKVNTKRILVACIFSLRNKQANNPPQTLQTLSMKNLQDCRLV